MAIGSGDLPGPLTSTNFGPAKARPLHHVAAAPNPTLIPLNLAGLRCGLARASTRDAISQPIEIEGVQIRTGDFVLADIDGIVVIPEEQAESVVGEVHQVMNTENLVRKAILNGVSPKEAYLRYGKF